MRGGIAEVLLMFVLTFLVTTGSFTWGYHTGRDKERAQPKTIIVEDIEVCRLPLPILENTNGAT